MNDSNHTDNVQALVILGKTLGTYRYTELLSDLALQVYNVELNEEGKQYFNYHADSRLILSLYFNENKCVVWDGKANGKIHKSNLNKAAHTTTILPSGWGI